MTVYYSFEKGKYGGPCGAVFPFFRTISGLSPLGSDYLEFVPAGFLKCRGQILSADQYPNLARVIGVGARCIYKKEGTQLLEPNPDGTGGTLQLPDLGSKYIAGASNPGVYSNDTTFNPRTNTTVDRAGIEVEISSQGQSVEFFYDGNFRVPGRSITLTGSMNASSPPTSTDQQTLSSGQMLGHGHNATFKISRRLNYNGCALGGANWTRKRSSVYSCDKRGDNCPADSDFGLEYKFIFLEEVGTDAGTRHRHFGTFPIKNAENKSASTSNLLISASPISTTVNVNTSNTIKMDTFAPKFILCEYLIKF
jgi:hypothetical protein